MWRWLGEKMTFCSKLIIELGSGRSQPLQRGDLRKTPQLAQPASQRGGLRTRAIRLTPTGRTSSNIRPLRRCCEIRNLCKWVIRWERLIDSFYDIFGKSLFCRRNKDNCLHFWNHHTAFRWLWARSIISWMMTSTSTLAESSQLFARGIGNNTCSKFP